MLKSKDFAQELINVGYDFFTGVPCTIIGNLIADLTNRPDVNYVPSVREDVAVAVASGAYMAGKRPAVLMQNSGLGQCLNVLTSLNLIYNLPCLLIITWRGHNGKDAPEHLVMGEACTKILEAVGISYHVIDTTNVKELIDLSYKYTFEKNKPVALFLKKGIID